MPTFGSVGTTPLTIGQGDYILCPPKQRFKEEAEYYGTIFHEIVHWTGHESRLNRANKPARFGDQSYAEEELIAEIGIMFHSRRCGVPQTEDWNNHKAYVAHWLEALNKDSRFIFRAASAASKAADYDRFVRSASPAES